jgi:hypothetical protein
MGTSFGFRAPGRETTPLGLDRQQVSADRDTIAQGGSGDIPHAAADAPRRGAAEFRRGRGISVAGTPERSAVVQQAKELVEFARGQGYRLDELVEIIEDVG